MKLFLIFLRLRTFILALSMALAAAFPGFVFAAAAVSAPETTTPAATATEQAEASSASSAPPSTREIPSGDFLASHFAGAEGDPGTALEYLEQAHRQDPHNAQLTAQLALTYLNDGEIAKAAAVAHGLPENSSRQVVMDFLLAADAVHEDHYHAAEDALSQVYVTAPGTLWVPLMKAWLQVADGTLQKPVQASDVLPNAEKAPPFLDYLLALINERAGFVDAAEAQYAAALADPAKAPLRAVEAAADFYQRQGEADKLTALKQNYLHAHPGMSPLVDAGDTAMLNTMLAGDVASGKSAAPLVASPQQGFAEVLFTMASMLYSVDAAQDAQLYLRMALYLRPDFPLAQLMLGSALEGEQRYAEAAEAYGSIAPSSPFYERGLLRRAYMIERSGKLDEALSLLDGRAEALPQDPEPLIAKGDLLRLHDRFTDAASTYSQAIKRIPNPGPDDWGVFFARGACYERTDDWERAEVDLRKAVKLGPDQPEALNYLGYSLLIRGLNLDEAKDLIERAYALKPDAPEIADSLGWALLKTGDTEGAVKYLEQATAAMPADATVNSHLGDAYWRAGRKTEARYQWQRALASQPEPALEKELQKKLQDGLPSAPHAAASLNMPVN